MDAIKPDTEPGLEKWLEMNTAYAKSWPNITQKKESPPDAKDFEDVEDKLATALELNTQLTKEVHELARLIHEKVYAA